MALRTFTDSRGTVWRVWETRPTSRTLRPEYVTGWLTFEQGEPATMRRRLAPIPEGWAALPEPELRRLCLEATVERAQAAPGVVPNQSEPPRTLRDGAGCTWSVHEVAAGSVPWARGPRCLLFGSEQAIRRVWHYPADWRTLSDAELEALSWYV